MGHNLRNAELRKQSKFVLLFSSSSFLNLFFLTKNRVCNYIFLVGYYLISCFTILPSLLIYLNLLKKLKGDLG